MTDPADRAMLERAAATLGLERALALDPEGFARAWRSASALRARLASTPPPETEPAATFDPAWHGPRR